MYQGSEGSTRAFFDLQIRSNILIITTVVSNSTDYGCTHQFASQDATWSINHFNAMIDLISNDHSTFLLNRIQ